VPKALDRIDLSAPVCCAPLARAGLDEDAALEIALRLKALADPVRVRLMSLILNTEDERGTCTCDLAPAVGLTEATVSHHLKQLREAGLVERSRDGANVWYSPRRDSLGALCQAIDPSCC
jgi:ArsR family transcriptional regulator